jgi:hypothetical protein
MVDADRLTGIVDRARLTEEEAGRVVSLMERYLPSAPLSWLVGAGASAVAAEAVSRDAAAGSGVGP